MKGTPALLGRITVATSFPPKLVRTNAGRPMEDYDRLCVQSWIACGFKIISLNAPDEIPALAARFPEVEFLPAERNANMVFGRKTPFIADILSALHRESGTVLGVINSDSTNFTYGLARIPSETLEAIVTQFQALPNWQFCRPANSGRGDIQRRRPRASIP
jgi:hypothetical protein